MANKFGVERDRSPLALGSRCVEYTPADADLPPETKAFFLNADGAVDIKNADGTAVTGIPATGGVPLPFVPARITGITTATKVYLVS